MLRRQFTVSTALQQFLTGIRSRAVANVILTTSYDGTAPILPSNPDTGVRRTMYYSHLDTESATPIEFDVFVQNLNGSGATQITSPR